MRRLSLALLLFACTPASAPEPTPDGAAAGDSAPPREATPAAATSVAVERGFADALACTGSFADAGGVRCELLRARADGLSSAALARETRIVVAREGEALIGVRLFGIRRDRLLGSVGLRNGDLVQRVAGRSIDSEQTLLDLLAHPPASPLDIEFVRQGERRRLTITLVDALSGPPRTLADEPAHVDVAPASPPAGPLCAAEQAECELDTKQLEGLLATTVTPPRFVPALREGVVIGVKIYSVRPGSSHAQLGLRNGDMLVRIDGVMPEGDGDPLAEPLARLASGEREQVEVELERRAGWLVRRFVRRAAAQE